VSLRRADWATRYPLKQMQPTRELFGQLIVMICPRGTYDASMGNMIPEAVQELTNLWVALVKGKTYPRFTPSEP
jgi:hypothetical protein